MEQTAPLSATITHRGIEIPLLLGAGKLLSRFGHSLYNFRRAFSDGADAGSIVTEWVLPSQIDTNPRVWQISVDGFPLDARYAPLEFQIEAYREGLIPYIPGIKK